MKHTRAAFSVVGWLLVLSGFAWIVHYSVIEVCQYFRFKEAIQRMQPNFDAMPKDELLDLYRKTTDAATRALDRRMTNRSSMLWAGLLMLSGTVVIQVAATTQRGDPNKILHGTSHTRRP